jgi:hypothetical protein
VQKADDLGLPPRTVVVRRDYFSPEEKELYLSLFSDAKRQFNTYLDQGTVLNSEFSCLLRIPFLANMLSQTTPTFLACMYLAIFIAAVV